MSDTSPNVAVPTWELHHRLARSIEFAKTSPTEMATVLGVHENTVYAWLKGTRAPKRGTLMAWALRTGVPFEWLASGETDRSPDGPSGQQNASTAWFAEEVAA